MKLFLFLPTGNMGRCQKNILSFDLIESENDRIQTFHRKHVGSCLGTRKNRKAHHWLLDGHTEGSLPKCTVPIPVFHFLGRHPVPIHQEKIFSFQTSPLQETIKIGEALTVFVYLKDEQNQYDVRVRDCWAYDNEAYDSPRTTRLQLTDAEGCPK